MLVFIPLMGTAITVAAGSRTQGKGLRAIAICHWNNVPGAQRELAGRHRGSEPCAPAWRGHDWLPRFKAGLLGLVLDGDMKLV